MLAVFKKQEVLFFLLALLVAAVVPWYFLRAAETTYYVDASVETSGDGSEASPFKTINEALAVTDGDDKVEVKAGTYLERLEIPEDVEVKGEDRDTVIIEATTNEEAAVKMEDGAELKKVTVKGGKYGVYVKRESAAVIEDCIIKESNDHGIKVKNKKNDEDYKVEIKENLIEDNDGSGIYAKEFRYLEILDNEILSNGENGIYLEGGIEAEIKDNEIKKNDKSGMDVMMDGSTLTIEDNDLKDNDDSGIEVHLISGDGYVGISECSFEDNGRYGIEQIQHGGVDASAWGGLELGSGNDFSGNDKGDISEITVKD